LLKDRKILAGYKAEKLNYQNNYVERIFAALFIIF